MFQALFTTIALISKLRKSQEPVTDVQISCSERRRDCARGKNIYCAEKGERTHWGKGQREK